MQEERKLTARMELHRDRTLSLSQGHSEPYLAQVNVDDVTGESQDPSD